MYGNFAVTDTASPALLLDSLAGQPDGVDCPSVCCNCIYFQGGNFVYTEPALTDAVVISRSSFVYISGMNVSHAGLRSDANGFGIYHNPSSCSEGITLDTTVVEGEFRNSLYIAPGGVAYLTNG